MESESIIVAKLEWLRRQMNGIAKHKGLADPQVLSLSQEIDELHNKLNDLTYYRPNRAKDRKLIRESSFKVSHYAYAIV